MALRYKHPVPNSKKGWLEEAVRGYADAYETLQVDPGISPEDLFHLGPSVCLKFRGIRRTKSNLKRATDAALTSFVATQDASPIAKTPQMAFAFCYIVSHFGLDLLDEHRATEILDYLAENHDRLVAMTEA